MCFSGLCECECISVCTLGLKWISVSIMRLIPIDVIFSSDLPPVFVVFWML